MALGPCIVRPFTARQRPQIIIRATDGLEENLSGNDDDSIGRRFIIHSRSYVRQGSTCSIMLLPPTEFLPAASKFLRGIASALVGTCWMRDISLDTQPWNLPRNVVGHFWRTR